MAVLGLILLAAAGVLTAAVVTSNTTSLSIDLWGAAVSDITVGVVFVAGMITTVLGVVGLGLLMGGMKRGRRLRQERRSLRRENEMLAQRADSPRAADVSDTRVDQRAPTSTAPRQPMPADPPPYGADPAPGGASAAPPVVGEDRTVPAESRRRSFLPRRDRENNVDTDSTPRNT